MTSEHLKNLFFRVFFTELFFSSLRWLGLSFSIRSLIEEHISSANISKTHHQNLSQV